MSWHRRQCAQTLSPSSDASARRWVAIAAILTGLLYLYGPWGLRIQANSEELNIANHLARGEGYLSPFSARADAPPTSWCPPIYVLCLAGIERAAGIETHAATTWILLLAVAARAAAAVALYELGRMIFGRGAGIAATALLMLHPLGYVLIGYVWDNYLALAMALWLTVWALRMSRSQQSWLNIALLGGVLGILVLTNSAYALIAPPLVLLASRQSDWRGQMRRASLAGALFLLAITPWTIRNYLVFNKLFFIRANASVELWIGNQPCSDGLITLNTLAEHPGSNPAEAERILRDGEIAYFQRAGDLFRQELSADPIGFVRRCANRAAYLLLMDDRTLGGRAVSTGSMLLAILASAGVVLMGKRAVWVWLGGWLAVAPYIVTHVTNRYSLPLSACSMIVAGAMLAEFARQLAHQCQPASQLLQRP